MKYLPVVLIVLSIAFVSCKKEQQAPAALSGKWQETKLVVYVFSANAVSWDTTYLTPFTSFDYLQFNDNGTSVSGSDFYLIGAPNGLSYLKTTQAITPGTYNFDYSAYGSVYVLTPNPNPVNYAGVTTADTVSIKGNTLLQHVVDYGPGPESKLVFDSYFIKQ